MCKPDNRKPVSRTLPGLRLRHLREHSGIPIPTVARKLGIAQATLLRIETGDPKIRCRPTMIAELSGIYGATDDVTRALSEAAELIRTGSRFDLHRNVLPLGLERCVDVEQCASMIRSHGAGRVPSLLQTGPYAAAAAGLGESEIWARIRFQQARTDAVQESAARFQFLIGESALVQPVAGAVSWLTSCVVSMRSVSWQTYRCGLFRQGFPASKGQVRVGSRSLIWLRIPAWTVRPRWYSSTGRRRTGKSFLRCARASTNRPFLNFWIGR